MQFLTVFQPLLISLLVCQSQGLVIPRGFSFEERERDGRCSGEDIEIIRAELKIVKIAAETAARGVADSHFFYAFQDPRNDIFRGKNFPEAAKQLYLRIAQLADESRRGHRVRIECRPRRCITEGSSRTTGMLQNSAHLSWLELLFTLKPLDPVMSLCKPFFTDLHVDSTENRMRELKKYVRWFRKGKLRTLARTPVNMLEMSYSRSKTLMHELSHTDFASKPIADVMKSNTKPDKAMEDYAYGPFDSYRLAHGMWKSGNGWQGDGTEGPRRAATNADNWALIGMGIYFANELGLEKIPITGYADDQWGKNVWNND